MHNHIENHCAVFWKPCLVWWWYLAGGLLTTSGWLRPQLVAERAWRAAQISSICARLSHHPPTHLIHAHALQMHAMFFMTISNCRHRFKVITCFTSFSHAVSEMRIVSYLLITKIISGYFPAGELCIFGNLSSEYYQSWSVKGILGIVRDKGTLILIDRLLMPTQAQTFTSLIFIKN